MYVSRAREGQTSGEGPHLIAEIPGLQDYPGGEMLTSLKVVGQGSVLRDAMWHSHIPGFNPRGRVLELFFDRVCGSRSETHIYF